MLSLLIWKMELNEMFGGKATKNYYECVSSFASNSKLRVIPLACTSSPFPIRTVQLKTTTRRTSALRLVPRKRTG